MPATLRANQPAAVRPPTDRSLPAPRTGSGRLPAAGCAAIREQVCGPARPGRVAGVFPSAVYVLLDEAAPQDGPGPPFGGVLAVVATDGIRLPNSLVLGLATAAEPFAGLVPGRPAVVGDGGIAIGPLQIVVRRWWRPAAAAPVAGAGHLERGLDRLTAGIAAGLTAGLGEELGNGLSEAVTDLVRAAAELDLVAAFAAADRMIGLGPGLTPSGDDVLCGFLVAIGQLAPQDASGLRAFAGALGSLVVHRAARATTVLSATLLAHAARGEAVPEVVELLDALATGRPVARVLPPLLAIGHSSGPNLAAGVAAGVAAVLYHFPGHLPHQRPRPVAHRLQRQRPHQGQRPGAW